MKTILQSMIVSIGLASFAMPVVALDFDKALERTSNLPKKSPVDAGSSSGLVGKSDDLHRQFMNQDDSDIARARANRVTSGTYGRDHSSGTSTSGSNSSKSDRDKHRVDSRGVREVRKADFLANIQFYRVTCNSGKTTVAGARSDGYWVDSGFSNMGDRYRRDSAHDFAESWCR